MFTARSFYPVPVFQNDQCQPTALVFATQCRMLIRGADLSFPNYFFIQKLKPVLISLYKNKFPTGLLTAPFTPCTENSLLP